MAKNSKNETDQLKEKMLKSLEAFHGNVRNAAKDAAVSERTHYRWCREDNEYNNAVGSLIDIRLRHAKEVLLDKAMLKIDEGNVTVLNKMLGIFYQNYGYEERHYNSFNDDPYVEEKEE